jgi:hypothetical protein
VPPKDGSQFIKKQRGNSPMIKNNTHVLSNPSPVAGIRASSGLESGQTSAKAVSAKVGLTKQTSSRDNKFQNTNPNFGSMLEDSRSLAMQNMLNTSGNLTTKNTQLGFDK